MIPIIKSKKRIVQLAILFFIAQCLYSQSNLKTLDNSDFLTWKTINNVQVSADGRYITYRLIPGEGDPQLLIYDIARQSTDTIARVSRSQLDYTSNILYGMITPARDSLRALERKKVDKKKFPADTFFILDYTKPNILLEPVIEKIPFATAFSTPSKLGDWVAVTIKAEALHQALKMDSMKSDSTKALKQEDKKKSRKDIVHLIIIQLSTGIRDTIFNVKENLWAEKDPTLLTITQAEDSTQLAGVARWKNFQLDYLKKQKGEYAKLSLSQDGKQAAFVGNLDTTKAQVPPYQLFYSDFSSDSAVTIASKNESSLPLVSQHPDLRWSEDGHYLYYGRAEMPVVVDTTLLPDEIVNVEVWSTEDPDLYPMQKFNKANEEKRSYLFAYDTRTKKHTGIGSPAWENTILSRDRNSRFALVYNSIPYEKKLTWESDVAKDLAIVDIQTGKQTPFRKEMTSSASLSPQGKFVYGYNDADSTWWTYQIITGIFTVMNRNTLPSFYDELNDTPGYPNPYGSTGWTTDDQSLILYDRYDIWSWSPMKGKTPVRLTSGRENKLVYRYLNTDPEQKNIPSTQPWLLHVFDETDKSSGYAWYNPVDTVITANPMEPYAFTRQVIKSRSSDTYVVTKENFQVFPDLRVSTDKLISSQQVSTANPQQADYKWGTIELYNWTDWNNQPRTGMLVKPFGYDTLHAYPMIVNFYERSSNDLYTHPTPFPHRSTINYALYASKGYVIFNPDITYTVGQPGESAYQVVMSGVTSLVKKGIADPNNLALQGHSWGGYQIAYILTRTNMFKCAEAGAAVVNMTSAYGGIRGESGRARMFQYEQEQSRIGKTLWEDPQDYIANSALFKIDKIETPLLLLHNDDDGAVPFSQGIEFYLALRRNGKKAWLLNYPGEPHWPVKWENRKDFQLKLAQFFDYYLMGKEEPDWMKGVPLVQKVRE